MLSYNVSDASRAPSFPLLVHTLCHPGFLGFLSLWSLHSQSLRYIAAHYFTLNHIQNACSHPLVNLPIVAANSIYLALAE